jgi:hypothetical protein
MIDQDGAPRRDVRSVMNGLSAKERADVARHWIPAWDRDEASRGPGPFIWNLRLTKGRGLRCNQRPPPVVAGGWITLVAFRTKEKRTWH